MAKRQSSLRSFFGALIHRLAVAVGAVVLTLAFFLVLPLLQAINKPPQMAFVVEQETAADVDPPEAPPEEEPPKEEEPDEKPPELTDDAPPLDLSQLELALNTGIGEGLGEASFQINIKAATAASGGADALFSLQDLDQPPRAINQPGPRIDRAIRTKTKNASHTVYIIFVVNKQGRVENPIIQKPGDPTFDLPALAAVKQWRFQPGKRGGQPVRFRMRVPITFPKGL
jgi:protein TonB